MRHRAPHLVGPLLALVAVVSVLACGVGPGNTYTGDGTFYNGGSGGNCSYAPEPDSMYAAMNAVDYENAHLCGAFVRATGPKGTVTVRIVDQCPECVHGDIDFSPEAFALIAEPAAGRVPISWQIVSGGAIGNVQYVVKDGANQWWFAIQPRNHRNVVNRLEVLIGGTWTDAPRTSYNYFIIESGAGPGPFTVRLTDIYGEVLVTSGIQLAPGVVQPSTSQFAAH